ncbi:MAG: hydroxymethylglutaryl-CoA synthase family protein [Myxococcales bacterium FL481]|nr:MAG: hydroxymethylglutaryl-CoA synthase family protein [Myxococcales bacterium FL481]
MTQAGVSGISVYVPPLRVQLEQWCAWTGTPWAKIAAVVGRSFRIPAPHENVYTMCANAVLRLIDAYGIDPQSVGYLGLGTESSTDNCTGAVIVKGMVDEALISQGRAPLSRYCEVPEFKQACLAGISALKGAVRYLACDGRGRRAIVVSADVAEYARGSTGEHTQGAGAVAMLVEEAPRLFEVDLRRAGSASDYRVLDFRKPAARHFLDGYTSDTSRVHDFPVFNGKYSTACYLDEVVAAADGMFRRNPDGPRYRDAYDRAAAILFHRPYHRMPQQGMAALLVWAMARETSGHAALQTWCQAAEVSFEQVLAEIAAEPRLGALAVAEGVNVDPYVNTNKVVAAFRRSPEFASFEHDKMRLGADKAMELGNLYTASLLAWLAAALEHAVEDDVELAGRDILAVGYGSGDAADVIPLRLVPDWANAAKKINFTAALSGAIDLSREQYAQLHDTGVIDGLDYTPRSEFVIANVGRSYTPEFQDIGIEYYRYVP